MRGFSLGAAERIALCSICIWLSVAANSLRAQPEEEQIVQELFASETVYPQERDELQVRVLCTAHAGVGREAFSVEYGLTDSLQLEVETEVLPRSRDADGAGFGLQWSRLYLGSEGFHLALGLENESGGGAAFGAQRAYSVAAAELEWLPGGAYLFGGWGLRLRESGPAGPDDHDEAEAEPRWDLSAGLVLGLTRRIRLTQEINWAELEWSGLEEPAGRLRWTSGVIWLSPAGAEIGIGFSAPVWSGRASWAFSIVQEVDGVLRR